jgi:uncharacterized protein
VPKAAKGCWYSPENAAILRRIDVSAGCQILAAPPFKVDLALLITPELSPEARLKTPEAPATAARLCAQCGLCCNGVMFHTVQLQPGDSAKDLAALGLKLKRKQGRHFILQPCPAFRHSQCSIYAARPERCRLFECQQLKRIAAGEITEAMALERIHAAKHRVEQMNELLHRAGSTNLKRPLSKRCEKALAEPLDPSSDPETVALRSRLTQAMQQLNALLNDHFRIVPGVVSAAVEAEAVAPAHDEP